MGGGKSTTLLLAKYFCHLAHALVISISSMQRGAPACRVEEAVCAHGDLCWFLGVVFREARDFTSGALPLAEQAKKWLSELPQHSLDLLKHVPYSSDPGGNTSLFDLIKVGQEDSKQALAVFRRFFTELQTQTRCAECTGWRTVCRVH
jgi:hypothetical protein